MNKIKIMRKWLFRICTSIIIIVLLDINFVLVYKLFYQNKIYGGIKVGNIDLGGLTREAAFKKMSQEFYRIYGQGVIFVYNGEVFKIPVSIKEEELPFIKSKNSIVLNITRTINQGFHDLNMLYDLKPQSDVLIINKINNFFTSNVNIYRLFTDGYSIKPVYELDGDFLANQLDKHFRPKDVVPKNAKLQLSFIEDEPVFTIIPEKFGSSIDIKIAIKKLRHSLENFTNKKIVVAATSIPPDITRKDALPSLEQINSIVSLAPIVFNITGTTTKQFLDKKLLAQSLELKKVDNNITISLNDNFKDKYLTQLNQKISIEPKDAVLRIINNKVTAFGFASSGIKLDIDRAFDIINNEVIKKHNKEIVLTVDVVQPRITDKLINDFGIKEIIGVGNSNFKGSPKNRRHNIALGAKTLNGIVIKPGETFSLIQALGQIEEKTGYLSELVIKGDRTVPEFGGGLCQIGTTIFRATLNSGLPVIERRNHSFRVSYYEPAGVDATIYSPRPDYRFKNDTVNNILIQTKIINNDLLFEFWGTKDGRTIEQTKPKVYNIVKPQPTKIIETSDLPQGKKKCVEKAANGAEAEFDYKVVYKDGKTVAKKFKSFYKPWRAICLVGKTIAPEINSEEISIESASRILNTQ